MIVGIGNDIIEIERIEKVISKEDFKNKIYSQRDLLMFSVFSFISKNSLLISNISIFPP